MPSQRHMTTPRQYIGPDGRVLLPGNSARNAISEEFARAAMLPGESRSEKPVFAERKGTQFKPESSINSGKQEKEKDDKRRGLKEEFARRNDRRPDRARCRSAMKLDQCDSEQGKGDQETKRCREVLGEEKSTQTKHPSD